MAIRAAEMALPRWKATPAPKRGEILYRFGERILSLNASRGQ